MTFGPLDLQDYYFEHKRQQVEAMKNARGVIQTIGEAYGKLSGRPYGLIESYRITSYNVCYTKLLR